MRSWVRRFPLAAYFILVFGVLLLLFLALRATAPPVVAVLVGSWLPNVIAVVVTGMAEGRQGLGALFGRVVQWRFGLQWYAAALLGPAAVAFVTVGLYALLGHPVPDFAPAEALLPIALMSLVAGATGEELGWRGMALPRLQIRWNVLVSGLVLGVLWGLYHLPAWWMPGTPQAGAPFTAFMLCVVPFNLFISWVFNHAGGSLIAAFLAHFGFNLIVNVTGILAIPDLTWLLAIVWWGVAIAIAACDRGHFTRRVEFKRIPHLRSL
jgi:CAAX protease family protein